MKFEVQPQKLREISSSLQKVSGVIRYSAEDMRTIAQQLKNPDPVMNQVAKQLISIVHNVEIQMNKVNKMSQVLQAINQQYINTEKAISSNGIQNYAVDSIVFDDKGSYGGDQGHMDQTYKWDPFRCWELLWNLQDYYPNMDIFKAFKYFERLNEVGCGYVGLANSIFMKYASDSQGFEKTFGFPMYNHGDLNYDRLILDIYCTVDLANIHDESDGWPRGIRAEKLIPFYLSSKGVSADIQVNVKVTPNNAKSILESNDALILEYYYDNIYREDGSVAQYIDGGHTMIVTGITDDGRYTVSSWGDKYYIPAGDLDADDLFTTVNYF